ncbi:helix-turn-helix transcriptional regulator [Sphaerisporangium sp. NPDC005288]|uniref:helix-turn-helix transcriptional regulator n=1 Tax=Sphaerisporangium sp. NPDC005288 TaxID=3155114 RepID=UPI00339FDA90
MENLPVWAARLRAERRDKCWTQREMARALADAADPHTRARLPTRDSLTRMIKDWEAGKHRPKDPYPVLYCRAFGIDEAELFPGDTANKAQRSDLSQSETDDEINALELAQCVAASDVGNETLERLELVVDDLATAYPSTPPDELLPRIRKHLTYAMSLLDAKKTLIEHRRLLVVGGWLSLLASTCNIDLRRFPAANAQLKSAAQLAKHTEHPELAAWCLETEAWQAVTNGDYGRALTLSHGAQAIAPHGSSAYIQATAQEGRVWARMGAAHETRDALNRVARLVSPLPMPDRPEHHYRYDPAKSDAYVATTLSWLGDPAAEQYARQVLARLETATDGSPRPRRAVSARIDLALALMAANQPDEAGQLVLTAVTSGLLVPSNYWRAKEVIRAIEVRHLPEAVELREAYRELCRP